MAGHFDMLSQKQIMEEFESSLAQGVTDVIKKSWRIAKEMNILLNQTKTKKIITILENKNYENKANGYTI